MKKAGLILLSSLLVAVFTANAQEVSDQLPSNDTSIPASMSGTVSVPRLFALTALVPAFEPPAFGPSSANALPMPQVPIQAIPHYSLQAYIGYTFVRLYAYPGEDVNRNGFDLSMSYYPKAGLIGLEGALTTTFGSMKNQQSDFVLFGGGPRIRWAAPRGVEVWAHGLAGDGNFGPKVTGFDQNALSWEVGGGVDINAHLQHFAYRAEVDMVGTRFYDTAQYSPKFSVGVAYKF